MTLHLVQLERKNEHKSFRLTRSGDTTRSDTRPDIVLPVEQVRQVLAAAGQRDVARGGAYSAGPAGVQVWSGPWNSPTGGPGTAEHLGSVDWSYDTPTQQYCTIYRVMLTAAGADARLTTDALVAQVLAMAGLDLPSEINVPASIPLPRDPFASAQWRSHALSD